MSDLSHPIPSLVSQLVPLPHLGPASKSLLLPIEAEYILSGCNGLWPPWCAADIPQSSTTCKSQQELKNLLRMKSLLPVSWNSHGTSQHGPGNSQATLAVWLQGEDLLPHQLCPLAPVAVAVLQGSKRSSWYVKIRIACFSPPSIGVKLRRV